MRSSLSALSQPEIALSRLSCYNVRDVFELFSLLADLSKRIEEGSIAPRAFIIDSLGTLLSPLLASQAIGGRVYLTCCRLIAHARAADDGNSWPRAQKNGRRVQPGCCGLLRN